MDAATLVATLVGSFVTVVLLAGMGFCFSQCLTLSDRLTRRTEELTKAINGVRMDMAQEFSKHELHDTITYAPLAYVKEIDEKLDILKDAVIEIKQYMQRNEKVAHG